MFAQPWPKLRPKCLARNAALQAAGGFAAPLAMAVTILVDVAAERHLGSPNQHPK